MNPEIKQRWIDALRSGEYEQARKRLLIDGKFCCLGVLTDIYIKETNQEWGKYYDSEHSIFKLEEQSVYLPRSVVEWAGLPDMDPRVNGRVLSEWNDTGKTFEEIANFIEKGL